MSTIYGPVPELLPADIADLSNAIYEGVFQKPELMQFHSVRTGYVAGTRLPIMGIFSGLLGSIQDGEGCEPVTDEGAIVTSSKLADPKYLSGRVVQCYKDLMGGMFQWLLAKGRKKEDLQNSAALSAYAETILADALAESVLRVSWFGDTEMEAGTGNSIGAGQLKYFTPIDGFFKQAAQIVAVATERRITIDRNSEVTDADQRFDASDVAAQTVTNLFTQAVNAADERFAALSDDQKAFICTRSVRQQYKAERKAVAGIPTSYDRVENGIPQLLFDGIEVIEFPMLDRILKAFYRGGSNAYTINPHRFILTTKGVASNLAIITSMENDFKELDVDYDKKKKEWYADYGYDIDAKILNDNFIVYGY